MNQYVADEGGSVEADPPFFVVSSVKFFVMSVFTFGLYDIFWFFMHWKAVRAREKSDIWPAARGILLPILFCHALFVRMRDYGDQFGYKPIVPIWLVTVAFIIANVYSVFVRDVPAVFVGLDLFLVPLILLPMQMLADKINMRVAPTYPYNRRFSITNIAGIVLGAIGLLAIYLASQNIEDIDMWNPTSAPAPDSAFMTTIKRI